MKIKGSFLLLYFTNSNLLLVIGSVQHLDHSCFFALLSRPLYNHIIMELFRLTKPLRDHWVTTIMNKSVTFECIMAVESWPEESWRNGNGYGRDGGNSCCNVLPLEEPPTDPFPSWVIPKIGHNTFLNALNYLLCRTVFSQKVWEDELISRHQADVTPRAANPQPPLTQVSISRDK